MCGTQMSNTIKTWTPTITTGLGALTQFYGKSVEAEGYEMEGDAERARWEYDAKTDEMNAENARFAAREKRKAGERNARKLDQRTRMLVGRQKTAYASSGLDVNVGAPVDVMSDSILAGADDAAIIRRNAAMEAWGLNARAAGNRAQADQSRIKGMNASSIGKIKSGATMLTSFGMVADTFNEFSKAKGWI
jgi:hypothetical protein